MNDIDRRRIEENALAEFSEEHRKSQCQRILESWFPVLREKTDRGGDDGDPYERRVEGAAELLRDFKRALSAYRMTDYSLRLDKTEVTRLNDYVKATRGTLWIAPTPDSILSRPAFWSQASPVARPELDSVIARYVSRPELQSNLVDWCALNALLYDRFSRSAEGVKSGVAFGEINWRYALSEGSQDKLVWITLGFLYAQFALRWVIPILTIVILWYLEYAVAAMVVSAMWGTYQTWRLASFPWRRKRNRANVKRTEEALERVNAMEVAWSYCCADVIHPSRLKERVVDAENVGVIYQLANHTILDKAIARDPYLFLPSHSAAPIR